MPRGNRDSWCTPKWLADALGWFDLDPCSNQFSWVQSHVVVRASAGGNGLAGYDSGHRGYYTLNYPEGADIRGTDPSDRVFINPPYSRGQVARWVAHYKHTDFCFLLRWDPSTAWFKELIAETRYVWFANQRINFEPPPGIASSSNPYPHALFFRSQPPQSLQGLGMTLANDSICRYTRESNISRIRRSAFAGVGGGGH